MLALREEARQGFADLLGVDPAHVALVESTGRGCATVLAGLGLTGEDEVITTDQEHFGLRDRCTPLARTSSSSTPTRMRSSGPSRRRRSSSRPRTCSGRPAGASTCTALKRESGLPILVDGAQSAGAIRSTSASSTSTRSPPRSGSARPIRRARSTSAIRTSCASTSPSYSRRSRTSSPARSCREEGARAVRRGLDRACPRSPGSSPRSAPSGVAVHARRGDGGAVPQSCSRRTSRL